MMKHIKQFIVPVIPLLISGCIAPTFETASVEKHDHGWIGFTGGYRSFDYYIPDGDEYGDSQGWIASMGYSYGFTENIGIALQGAFYYYSYKYYPYGQRREKTYLPTLSLALKIEPTKATSKVAFSVSTGPAYPDLIKTTFMVGYRENGHDVWGIGTHFFLFLPYDFFFNYRPFSDRPVKFYLGYRLPMMPYTLVNIAGGIGLEF
jgi:hypothetical protein